MRIDEVPVGCVIQFHNNFNKFNDNNRRTPLGGEYKITQVIYPGCYALEATDHFHGENIPATWSGYLCNPNTEVSIVDGFEYFTPVDPEPARQALLDLIGEPCTSGATTNTKVPSVTYLLDTGVIT